MAHNISINEIAPAYRQAGEYALFCYLHFAKIIKAPLFAKKFLTVYVAY